MNSAKLFQRNLNLSGKMFADMLLSPIMHTDCTNARVNGKSAYVFVCTTPDGVGLYFTLEKRA